jgi:hypothetical protein
VPGASERLLLPTFRRHPFFQLASCAHYISIHCQAPPKLRSQLTYRRHTFLKNTRQQTASRRQIVAFMRRRVIGMSSDALLAG